MWNIHKPEDFEMVKTGKDETPDSKPQEYGGKVKGEPSASALATILSKIGEEEDQE